MNESEIRDKLAGIFREVFDDPSIAIADSMTAKDVPNWDSITHVDLIVSVEKAFRVSFTTREVKSLENVGDFVRLIASRAG
jgi:acyl carrier protein